ncbi:MAG: CCA tRNA nucleotidyltransferase [Planctomycetaceae bacterium]
MSAPHPQRDFARDVVARLRDAGFQALFAGGCVRDLLMGREPQDYDVATAATPEQVRNLFGKRRTLAVGASFGVIIVLGPSPECHVEVATFRADGNYADGRRPDRVEFSDPQTDAQRRDFTINGMFFDPIDERVIDYVGGQQDLEHHQLRAIGDPRVRFTEDKLRLLRAVRFTATLDFELEADTARAVAAMADQILVVSWERITQELKKMLVNRHRRRAMTLCDESGLLANILPELAQLRHDPLHPDWLHTLELLDELTDPTFPLALATLLHRLPIDPGTVVDIAALCRRLKLSNDETDSVVWLTRNSAALDAPADLTLAQLKRLLAHRDAPALVGLLTARARVRTTLAEPLEFVLNFLARTPPEAINPPPLIDGADLKRLGLQPGPRFRELLDGVRELQLNSDLTTTSDALDWIRAQLT